MKISRLALGSGIAGLALAAGVVAAGGPASAGSCSGSGCAVDGAVTVNASISLAMPVTSFNDGSLNAGSDSGMKTGTQGGAGVGQLAAVITSGDAGGYALTVSPTADWTAGANHFPASDLGIWRDPDVSMLFNGTQWSAPHATEVQVPEPGDTPATLDSSNAVSAAGGDSYYYATQVTPPLSAGQGAYAITLNFTAIGN